MMVCIVAGGQAQKPKAKTTTAKTTQVKSQKSQSSQQSHSSQQSQKSQSSHSSHSSQQSQSSHKSHSSQQPSQKAQLQAQQRQLQKNIAANKTRKAELEKKVKEQLEAVLVLGDEINEKQRTIDTIRVSLDSLDAQLLVLEGQLDTLRNELSDRQQRYAQSVRFMHRNNKMQSKMMFVFSAKNINQMYRRTRFIKEYATYQRAQGEAVKQKQQQVEQKQQELTRSKEEKAVLLARGEREQQRLETQQSQRQKMADELQKQKKTVATLITQQEQQEADLNKRIDQLIAEEVAREKARQEAEKKRREQELARQEQQRREREQRLAEAKAREEKAKADAKAAKTNEAKAKARQQAKTAEKERKSAERELAEEKKQNARNRKEVSENFAAADPDARLSGSFASNKGRLPMPITGAYKVVRGFGSNVVDGARGVHLSSKGIYLKGQPGAQARCVFNGEVSKIYYTGNSYIVMVRHGRYISVYSDLASVHVSAGQKVNTNQTLGNLGPTNIMQFQLRNWTELLNPRSWLRR